MPQTPTPATRHEVRLWTPDAMPADLVHAWAALEDLAAEPNAYASPDFVLPALKHLDAGSGAQILTVEYLDGRQRMLTGVIVMQRRFTPGLPVPHARSYASVHSFCGSPLIHREHVRATCEALLQHLRSHLGLWAWQLDQIEVGGPIERALSAACEARGLQITPGIVRRRAMLRPEDTGLDALKRNLRKTFNEVERCRRRMGELGTLEWRVLRTGTVGRATEDFLRLEHAGWKQAEGTSLRSHDNEERFFTEVVANFEARGKALFTELTLDGVTIASTSNFVSGGMGFAFKVGWNPEYRKQGIGILNEAELVRHWAAHCADLQGFDSGAEPASFIEKLWPAHRELGQFIIHFNSASKVALGASRWARSLVQRLRSAVRPAPAPVPAPAPAAADSAPA